MENGKFIIQHKAGEYFGLVNSSLAKIWDDLPNNRPILCTNFHGLYGKSGFTVSYRKDYLNKPEHISKSEVLLLTEKPIKMEAEMALSDKLVSIARENGSDALEKALQENIKVLIRRAYKRAEETCEFVAMAEIAKIQEKYGTPSKSGEEIEIKDAKTVKVSKDKTVVGPIWNAITQKANKLGAIVSSTGSTIEVRISKTDAKVFEKACSVVKGITVA